MATINILIKSNKIAEYEFGYSEINDVSTVSNWQTGNNVFVGVDDGTYYVFARVIGSSTFLRYTKSINCTGCSVAANGFYDITPNDCRVAANGYYDITAGVQVTEGILIIGIEV